MYEKIILPAVLAGGKSNRFGKDKSNAKLGDKTLLEHTISKLENEFSEILIVTNNNNLKVINKKVHKTHDCIDGQLGPLVGILSGMMWAKKQKRNFNYLSTFPCDAPFFPEKLVKNLIDETKKNNFDIVIPRYKDQNHPVFGIWSLDLIDSLKKYLLDEDLKKIDTWIFRNKYKILNFKDLKYDPFFNINTVQELSKANSISSEFDI